MDTATEHALVVDDDVHICEFIVDTLNQEGLSCRSCSSGREALELLAQGTSDAVISDLRMPEMSGLELLKGIRQKFPFPAFVMVTGENDIHIGADAMKRGTADYMVKPFHHLHMVSARKKALETKRLEKEIESCRLRLEQMVEQRTKRVGCALLSLRCPEEALEKKP